PSTHSVGTSTSSVAPQLGAAHSMAGSTNSGEVIARAAKVQTLAAAGACDNVEAGRGFFEPN
ncbi:MAG: hypothetical protein WCH99_17975, partial [Verrucomicrobiota bacterium]